MGLTEPALGVGCSLLLCDIWTKVEKSHVSLEYVKEEYKIRLWIGRI